MKTQIRNAVFETNSSSSHSVTVDQAELADYGLSKEVLREGVIRGTLQSNAYGWAWRRFYDPGSKIAYLMLQLAGGYMPDGADELQATDDHVELFKNASSRVEYLIDVVEEATGCRFELNRDDASLDYGFSIDHDSAGVGLDLIGEKEDLLKFIFGKNSYLETSNDNGSAPETIPTDRGDEAYYEHLYVDAASHGERFELTNVYVEGLQRGIRFEHRGEVIETGEIPYEERRNFDNCLKAVDVTFTGFKVHINDAAPGLAGRNVDGYLRNLVVSHHSGMFEEATRLQVVRDFEVIGENKPFKPKEGRARASSWEHEYQADYTSYAVAAPESVEWLAMMAREIVERKAAAKNEVTP